MQLSESLLPFERVLVLAGLELLAATLEKGKEKGAVAYGFPKTKWNISTSVADQVLVVMEKVQRGFDLVSVVHRDDVQVSP